MKAGRIKALSQFAASNRITGGNLQTIERLAGFTRVELLVILAGISLLVLTQLPLLGKSREGNHEAVCMNNLRQLGLAMLMYTEENRDFVPEEGNTSTSIADTGSATTTDNLHAAWYNLAVQPYHPRLVDLYGAFNAPLPSSGSIFSCPSAPAPDATYNKPPTVAQAFFMYGENARLCVNFGTRISGIPQTRLSTISKPSVTIFMAEVDPNSGTDGSGSAVGASQSNVAGDHSAGGARHQGLEFFTMTDGHVRAARTNEFVRTTTTSAANEWMVSRSIYWYPTPTTPN